MCEDKAYWGLAAIAHRMGWNNIYQPVRAISSMGFLMFKRRSGPRYKWYTTEALIQQWELSRCKLAADEVKERERVAAEKRKRKKDTLTSEGQAYVDEDRYGQSIIDATRSMGFVPSPLVQVNLKAEEIMEGYKQACGIAGDLSSIQNAIPISNDNHLAPCGVDNSDHVQKETK